jgi:hypothetical protein
MGMEPAATTTSCKKKIPSIHLIGQSDTYLVEISRRNKNANLNNKWARAATRRSTQRSDPAGFFHLFARMGGEKVIEISTFVQ